MKITMKDWIVQNSTVIIQEIGEGDSIMEKPIIYAPENAKHKTGKAQLFQVVAFDKKLKFEKIINEKGEIEEVNTNEELEEYCYIILMNGASLSRFVFNKITYLHVNFHEILSIIPRR